LLVAFLAVTQDFVPTRHDLRRLVERYGSVAHAARALGVDQHEFAAWLSGAKPMPMAYFDALLTLVMKSEGKE
jgi:hypothetical protein